MPETTTGDFKHYKMRLYNANRAEESVEFAQHLAETVRAACGGTCDIEIINVLEKPEEAVQSKIFATPTLVKELPEPIQSVLGNLENTNRLLLLLDVVCEGSGKQ